MSFKKGYNYGNVENYCEKYDCELLSSKEEIDLKPKKFLIQTACGHKRKISFNNLFREKQGIYCIDCLNYTDDIECYDLLRILFKIEIKSIK